MSYFTNFIKPKLCNIMALHRCNPIAETDLAEYMINCVEDQSKWNKILDIGGPDEGMTMKQQGEMIFSVLFFLGIYNKLFF